MWLTFGNTPYILYIKYRILQCKICITSGFVGEIEREYKTMENYGNIMEIYRKIDPTNSELKVFLSALREHFDFNIYKSYI